LTNSAHCCDYRSNMHNGGAPTTSRRSEGRSKTSARLPGVPVKQPVTVADNPGLERHPGDNPDGSFLGKAHAHAHAHRGHQGDGHVRKRTTDTYFHQVMMRCQGGEQIAQQPQRLKAAATSIESPSPPWDSFFHTKKGPQDLSLENVLLAKEIGDLKQEMEAGEGGTDGGGEAGEGGTDGGAERGD